MAETTNEKVIRLETQMTTVVSEIAEVKALVKEIGAKIDRYSTLDAEIVTLKTEIGELKKKTFRNGWVFPTLSAVASAVLTLLVVSFLTQGK